MKKNWRMAAFLLATVFPAALAAQQAPTASSEISASGVAEIRVAPDHAVVSTTVETRDRTATGATSANANSVNNIMQALRKTGLSAEAVTTSDFTVDQYFPPRYDPRESQIPDGFITRTLIRAETDRIASVSGLIDAALAAGATRISVQYSSSKIADARRAALETAFKAARADALALAQAAGGNLGRLLSASPSGASPVFSARSVQMSGVVTTGMLTTAPTFNPGNLASSVVVTARWEFLSGGTH